MNVPLARFRLKMEGVAISCSLLFLFVVFWQIIMAAIAMDPLREKSLADYRKKLLEHKEVESRLKESKISSFFWCKSRSEIQSRRSETTHLKYCMSSTLFLSKANTLN
jgi:hypothetical protein